MMRCIVSTIFRGTLKQTAQVDGVLPVLRMGNVMEYNSNMAFYSR